MLMPTNIRDVVEQIIRHSENYLTAYQILERLPPRLRDQLLNERGASGQEGRNRFTAVTVVTQAASMLCDAGTCECVYIDSGGIQFEVAGELLRAGNTASACYRIPR